MTITETRIRLMQDGGKMLAVATVTFDDCFVVHDIKVIDGEKGVFVAMPARKQSGGEYMDIAHPINQATRDMVRNAVLEAYDRALREQMNMTAEQAEKIAARFF